MAARFLITHEETMTLTLVRPSYYTGLFKRLLSFTRHPVAGVDVGIPLKQKLTDTAGLFVIKLFLLLAIAVLMAVLSPVFDPQNVSIDNIVERFSPIALLFVAGLALPLLEEVGFRLSLTFKPIYLALSLGVLCYYFLTKVVFGTSNSLVDESFALRVGVSLAICAMLYLVFRLPQVSKFLCVAWKKHFRWIFYVTCAAFALVHLFNFKLSIVHVVLMPLITLPQIVSGIIYGYARVTLGFQYALLAHIANNLLFVLSSFLPEGDLIL